MLKDDAAESCGAEQFSFNRLCDSRDVLVRSGRNPVWSKYSTGPRTASPAEFAWNAAASASPFVRKGFGRHCVKQKGRSFSPRPVPEILQSGKAEFRL
jgi:hypothetical protein